MSTTIRTAHTNELIMVDDVLDPQGTVVVALGLSNQDHSDTFPGRTLTPDQAEELAATLAHAAAAARAVASLAPAPIGGEEAYADTLTAIRAAVPLTDTGLVPDDGHDEPADASASPAAPTTARSDEGDVRDLPIADYDRLSAAVITRRLSGLSDVELSTLLDYEQSHRNRKTVCERIAALRSSASRAAKPIT